MIVVTRFHINLQVILVNSDIHIGNKQVFWVNFRCAGVIYIPDLLDDNLELKSIEMLNSDFIYMSFIAILSTEISNSKKLVDRCR